MCPAPWQARLRIGEVAGRHFYMHPILLSPTYFLGCGSARDRQQLSGNLTAPLVGS
jgi:hypothetical protein